VFCEAKNGPFNCSFSVRESVLNKMDIKTSERFWESTHYRNTFSSSYFLWELTNDLSADRNAEQHCRLKSFCIRYLWDVSDIRIQWVVEYPRIAVNHFRWKKIEGSISKSYVKQQSLEVERFCPSAINPVIPSFSFLQAVFHSSIGLLIFVSYQLLQTPILRRRLQSKGKVFSSSMKISLNWPSHRLFERGIISWQIPSIFLSWIFKGISADLRLCPRLFFLGHFI